MSASPDLKQGRDCCVYTSDPCTTLTAARNLALLRKIALNLVGRDQTTKASARAKRKKAAWNDAYMLQLLVR